MSSKELVRRCPICGKVFSGKNFCGGKTHIRRCVKRAGGAYTGGAYR